MVALIAIIRPLGTCSFSPALVMAYWIGMYKASDKVLSTLQNNPAGFDTVHDRIRKWNLEGHWLALVGRCWVFKENLKSDLR